jgi:hypothetical protein
LGTPVAERATRRRRAGAGRESGVAGVGWKGKADGWGPPVSCPGGKEVERRDGLRSWAGPACAGWRACGGGREKGWSAWAWVAWVGGLAAH